MGGRTADLKNGSALRCSKLKGLHKLDQIPLFIILQLGAEGVARIGIPRHADLILEAHAFGIRAGSEEAHILGVIDIVARIELCRPPLYGHQQVPEGGDLAVVQVRRACPDPIQGRITITVGLAIGVKLERRSLERVEFIHQGNSKRVQAMAIGADNVDGRDLSCLG